MKRIRDSRLFRLSGLLLGVLVWMANNANPPNGNTGAPFDNHCNTCHDGGNPNNFNGDVIVDGMPASVDPNTVYPLTITLTPTAGSPIKGGFQLVAVDGNNANCGNLANSNAQSGTEFYLTREYLDHRGGKNFSGGSASWNFTWTSPATVPGGMVKFYFIGNFTNGSGTDNGDYPIAANATYPFNGPAPVTATISDFMNVSCFGGNNGSATVEANGGLPPYTYQWSPGGQTTQTAVNLTAGTYTVTVTGSSGTGSATASVTITQPPQLNASASVSGTITCAQQQVTVTGSASGGTPGYSYEWDNGFGNNPTTYTEPGSHTFTVTDNNGCTKVATFNINSNLTPPTAEAGPSAAISCAQPTATLNGAGSSTGPTFSYLWTTSDGNIVSGANTLTPVVNAAGTYQIVVTNSTNGCTSSDQTTVSSSAAPPNVAATGGQVTCTTSSVQLTSTTNASQPSFAWTGPNGFTSTQQNPTAGATGVYTVVVTDGSTGCSASATASITQNTTPPTVNATSSGLLTCTTLSFALSGSSNAGNYAWTGPNGFTSMLQNPTVSQPGIYMLVSTAGNGCTASDTAIVLQNIAPPGATATANGQITCTVLSVQLSGSSPASNPTYAWTGPNGFSSTQQNPTVQNPGTYILTVTSTQNGCTSTASATVVQNIAPPGATAAANGQITCSSASVQLSGSSPAPNPGYSWTGPNGFASTQQNPTVQNPGDYVLVVTSSQNGCTSVATATVVQNTAPPTASAVTPASITCASPSIQLNGTASSQGANFTYQWTTTNGNIVSGATTLTPTVDETGAYNLLVTNTTNGCTAAASVTVTQNPPVSASIGASTNVSCNGGTNGSATVAATGGNGSYTYAWSTGATSSAVSNLPAGTYTVSVFDGESCSATSSVTITQPDLLLANASATGETAAGANDGTATAAPTGGTMPYNYLWSNNATAATITNLAPGNYTVSITDFNGCTAVQTVTVNSFNCSISASIASTNVTCNGAGNGAATVNLSGAAQPVTFLWSNNATTQTVTNLAPGTYTVQITDANNCPAQLSVSITEPAPLLANATATGETAAGANDGSATAQPTGGTAAYSFAWSNGPTTPAITNLAPGNYTVSVTDANGCTAVQTVTVNGFNCALTAQFSTANVLCAGQANGQATVTISGGALPFSYAWSNGDNTATADELEAGTYSVSVADANNCLLVGSVTITEPDPLVLTVVDITQVICTEDQTGAIEVAPSGGTPSYQLAWSSGQNGQNLGVGNYSVSLTDANGCTTSQMASIVATDNQPPVVNCPTAVSLACPGEPTFYDAPTFSDNCNLNGTQPILVGGLPSGSIFPEGTTTQVFQLTDALENTASCSFSITVTPNPAVTLDAVVNDSNNSGSGSIDITVESPGATFEWEKDGVFFATDEDLTGLTAGEYSLVVTFPNGCTTTLPPITVENITVSAAEPGNPIVLRIVPNPVRDILRLEINEIALVQGQIFDARGSLVWIIPAGELATEIEVSELPGGLYYLSVLGENGYRGTLKFIKAD